MTRNLSLLAAATAITSCAHASHIDLMTDGVFSVSGTSIVVDADPSAVIGGARFVGTMFNNAELSRDAGDDFITYTNYSGLSSAATLQYGDFDGGNGALDADLISGWNSIQIDIRRVVGLGQLRVDFESNGEVASAESQSVSAAGLHHIVFNDPGLRGLDFTDIDRISIRLLGANGTEFDIGPITLSTIPAPPATGLAGIALLASVRRRRR